MQLINQFNQIFKFEKVDLMLRPYEIISLGPSYGMMEMVKDSITIDSLKQKLYKQYGNKVSLSHFFNLFYGKNIKQAKKNFCKSLAAYSLICYFLQIKDRHNGNILLHIEGYLIHIDFGFFFTNAPGKGLEFEGPVPFKLVNEHVEVLGGVNSKLF